MPYYFHHWERDGVDIGSANPTTISVLAPTTVVAVYAYSEVPPPPKCFIATAAYGSPLAPQLYTLRKFRDIYLPNPLVYAYYKCSPPLANFIGSHNNLRLAVRHSLKPLLELIKCLFKK